MLQRMTHAKYEYININIFILNNWVSHLEVYNETA